MGVSSGIGASGIKAGVVNDIAGRPASPFEGQVIFQKDTDQLLVWNGTVWVIPNSPAQNPTGLELITTCTGTSAGGTSAATASGGVVTIGAGNTSVTVSSAFSSTYDNYQIVIAGGVASTNLSLDMTLGSTVSGYKWCLVYTLWAGTVFSDMDAAAAKMRYVGRGDTNSLGASVTIMSPFLAKNTRVTGTAISNADTGSSYGMLFDSTSYTAFTITPNGGALTGGTIRVYGYRNS